MKSYTSTGEISADTLYASIGALTLESGDTLADVTLAYRTWGTLNQRGDNAVLVCHALTGSADTDVWWPGLIGPGRTFNPAEDFVVCSNVLGGCYGSTGPLSPRPGVRERYGGHFPQITIRDMVNAQARLLDNLGIRSLRVVTGASMGGMQALEWAASYPERVRAVAPIGVSGRHSAWCIAISESQRAAIVADPKWRDGHYASDAPPTDGLAVARMIAMCSYRSWTNFDSRFARRRNKENQHEVATYLNYHGLKLTRRFDAMSYMRLTEAMDSHDLARGRGEYTAVLAGLTLPALLVGVSSDLLYPPHEQRELANLMPGAEFAMLESDHGHDSFLIDTAQLDQLLAGFLRAQPQPVAAKRA